MLGDRQIDSVLLSFVTPFFVDCEAVAREVVAIAASTPKPIVCVVMTEKTQWRATLEIFRQAGLPTFDLPEIGARVLGAMVRYASRNS
jgi:acyl-CoA synthetase (NDP forming)